MVDAITPRMNGWDVLNEFLKTKLATASRAVYTSIDVMWKAGVLDEKSPVAKGVHYHTKLVKLAHAPGEALDHGIKLVRAGKALAKDPSWDNKVTTFFAVNDIVHPIYDMCEFATKAIWHLPKEWFHTFGGVNGVTLAIGKGMHEGYHAVDKFSKIDFTKETERAENLEKATSNLIKIAKSISYLVLGLLIAVAVFFNMVASPVVFTAASASTVFFSIFSFFYDNLGKEIKKTSSH